MVERLKSWYLLDQTLWYAVKKKYDFWDICKITKIPLTLSKCILVKW